VRIKSKLRVDGSILERMYVCLFACKIKFNTSYRALIGHNVCFFKGTYEGQLLSIVGKDDNNQIL